MPGSQYQIIAETPVDDFAVLERVQKGLSRTYKVDLSSQRAQLRRGGVCVCKVETLAAAQEQAEVVRAIGADYRILDPQGRVIGRGQGRRGPGAELGGQRTDATMMGGFDATPITRTRLSDPALALTQASAPKPPPTTTSGLDLLPSGSDATPDPRAPDPRGAGFNLDSLDADDLVLLDGSREEALSAASPLFEQPVSAAAFAPPTEDDVLELDERAAPARPAPPRVPKLPSPSPGAWPAQPAGARAPAAPQEEEIPALADLVPTATPEPVPPPAQSSHAPAPQPRPAPAAPTAAPRSAIREARRTVQTASARRGQKERVLFGGWFRQRPRLRIVTGFLLALGLGAVAPVCQSRSVVSSRIRPQLEDLSTARTHGALLARLPNYRRPEEIEETIANIKTRYSITSFLLWMSLAGLLVFLWFRFV